MAGMARYLHAIKTRQVPPRQETIMLRRQLIAWCDGAVLHYSALGLGGARLALPSLESDVQQVIELATSIQRGICDARDEEAAKAAASFEVRKSAFAPQEGMGVIDEDYELLDELFGEHADASSDAKEGSKSDEDFSFGKAAEEAAAASSDTQTAGSASQAPKSGLKFQGTTLLTEDAEDHLALMELQWCLFAMKSERRAMNTTAFFSTELSSITKGLLLGRFQTNRS